MEKIIFMLILLSPFELAIAENNKIENLGFNITPKIEEKFCVQFGDFLSNNQDWSSIRPNNLKQKKLFIGKSISKYNPDDYYLWVDAYDVDGNNFDDLIAIDWHKRNKKNFYLAYYVFTDKGELFTNRRELRQFFLRAKLKSRNGSGYIPLFPERLLVRDKKETVIDESFVGFHEIKPVLFENKVFIVAKKKNNKREKILVFSFDATEKKINLLCDL